MDTDELVSQYIGGMIMEKQVQYAINELFRRDDILAKEFFDMQKELNKTKKKLKWHKAGNFLMLLYLAHAVLRHEVMIDKLNNERNE